MDCFSQCKGEVIAHTSHSLTVLETLHSLSACMTSPPRVALLTVFHQSYGSNGDLINKNTSCVVFHVVLSVRGHCSVWVCVCVHKAMRCSHVHIQSVATCRKCCSATAGTDDFCKFIKRQLLLLVTQGPSGFGSLPFCVLANCDPVSLFLPHLMCSDPLPSHFFLVSNPFRLGSLLVTKPSLTGWTKIRLLRTAFL